MHSKQFKQDIKTPSLKEYFDPFECECLIGGKLEERLPYVVNTLVTFQLNTIFQFRATPFCFKNGQKNVL